MSPRFVDLVADELDAQAEIEEGYVSTALLAVAVLGSAKAQRLISYHETTGSINQARASAERLRTRATELRGAEQ